MDDRTTRHWSEDPYWTDALEAYYVRRDGADSRITIDLKAVTEAAFSGDSPAYKLLDAMRSVWEKEGWDGYRGAPRVMLALLMRLAELSEHDKSSDTKAPSSNFEDLLRQLKSM
jgi:hypothetical protein